MGENKRPYLVVAKLVEQPTWGGDYIVKTKGWGKKKELVGRKIGQSYELFGETQLYTDLTSTKDKHFCYFLKDKEKKEPHKTIPASLFVRGVRLPLIKFTQAAGNSFQVHIQKNARSTRWKPKAESWYYFEKGCLTHGIKPGVDLDRYKQTCLDIEFFMKKIVLSIQRKDITQKEAEKTIKAFITQKNPWQFVNKHYVEKDTLVDLTGGGIHHSWEQDTRVCPQGNVLYEIQEDVSDEFCTIRAFDQGKLLREGGVRDIHVHDYFQHIDTSEENNKLRPVRPNKNNLLHTKHYCLDALNVGFALNRKTEKSFNHLFVRSGEIIVSGGGVKLHVGQGHSCFVPMGCSYTIESLKGETKVLVAYTC